VKGRMTERKQREGIKGRKREEETGKNWEKEFQHSLMQRKAGSTVVT